MLDGTAGRLHSSDKTTLQQFLEKIEKLYGKANRVWVVECQLFFTSEG